MVFALIITETLQISAYLCLIPVVSKWLTGFLKLVTSTYVPLKFALPWIKRKWVAYYSLSYDLQIAITNISVSFIKNSSLNCSSVGAITNLQLLISILICIIFSVVCIQHFFTCSIYL